MDRPIVVCGLGRMGSHVLDCLLAAKLPVVIIDTVCKPDDPRLRGARLIVGDCRRKEILEQADVAHARGVLILTNDDLLNVSTALMVRSLNPEVHIVLRMFNQNLLSRLGQAVHNVFALSTSLLTAPILALTALTGQALGTYRLDDSPDGSRQLMDVAIGPASPLRDQPIGSLSANRDVVVVAHFPDDGPESFLHDVSPDTLLRVGDHVVLHGAAKELRPLLAPGQEDDRQLQWATWLRRHARVAWRTLAEFDVAVVICTAVLLLVVLVSTIILKSGVEKYSIPTALLRTISIMATAADMHAEDYEDSPNVRVYVAVLRIVGAVLMAAFTAIVVQYLLRARLGGALEARRIPEAGHVIVCGLSTVGFRVVEELTRLGTPVVAIESDPTNRFIPTSRQLGAAVMVGDAGVTEVLRQAHAQTARAVIPATNNDMTNLEVALLVSELNTSLRVVVLLNDPQFARMLRDAAGIRFAVSVPALSAPAFLASLYGDRVMSVFFLRERLFAIIDLVITKQDPLAGLTIRVVAKEYALLPVALIHGDVAPARPDLEARLEAGDQLIAILSLSDLERLSRR